MRRTLSLCRGGLVAAAAAVLLTACGGGSKDDTASSETTSSSSSSSSASETTENTAPQADSEFCTEAAAIQERVTASLTGQDQSDLGAIFQQAAQEIRGIEPPAEIADEWASFADGIEEFASISQIDFNDQAAYQQWQQQAIQLQQKYEPAFTAVQTYLSTQCGLTDDESTDTSSPTS
jgi:ABC-type transport system substrate-binding protein